MRSLAAAAMMLLAFALPACSQPVRGAFAVLHDGYRPTREVLDSARQDGLTLVILQYTQGSTGEPEVGSAAAFIEAAEAARMDYMLGLHYHGTWDLDWQAGKSVEEYVNRSLALIPILEDAIGPRFKGWYMALEVANYDGPDYEALARAFAPFGNASNYPIAISIYFNPDSLFLEPAEFEAMIGPVIAPFDIVLLQDGVGKRGITDLEGEVRPYFEAVERVVARNQGQQMWAVVEAFDCADVVEYRQCEEPLSPLADPARLCGQVAEVRRSTPHVIAFSLGEFMHPEGSALQRRAYKAFVSAATRRPCPPPRED